MSGSQGSVALGATSLAHERAGDAHGHNRGGHQSAASEMHALMGTMMAAMSRAPMTGDPDHDFLSMMIPHHQGAVDMARLVLVHGRDPLTRQLAEEIIASQSAEIASMQGRLQALKRGQTPDTDGFPALTGTRG